MPVAPRARFLLIYHYRQFTVGGGGGDSVVVVVVASLRDERDKTLSGGSLGSCVDEERSQLREVM